MSAEPTITDAHRKFQEAFFEARKEALGDLGNIEFAMKEADDAGLKVIARHFPAPSVPTEEEDWKACACFCWDEGSDQAPLTIWKAALKYERERVKLCLQKKSANLDQ